MRRTAWNVLGWKKDILINQNLSKDQFHVDLTKIYPSLKECQEKYWIAVREGRRSTELKLFKAGPTSGLLISVNLLFQKL
jgi:hypothetical protein